MLEVVISFLPTDLKTQSQILMATYVYRCVEKQRTVGMNSYSREIKKNLLIFFQQNYSLSALWNMLYIHHLNTGYIAN